MEKELVCKLLNMQESHNELGKLFGDLALSLRKLNQIYSEQSEVIEALKTMIGKQRNFIRNLGQNSSEQSFEIMNLDINLSKYKELLRNREI